MGWRLRSAAALLATLLKVSPFLSQEFSLAFLAGGSSGPKEAMAENWAPLMWAPMRDDAPNTVEVTNVEVLNRIRSLVAPPVPRVGLGAFGHAVDDAEEVE